MKNEKDARQTKEQGAKEEELKIIVKRLKVRSSVRGGNFASAPESADDDRCC